MDDFGNINLFDEQPEENKPGEPGDGFPRPLNRSANNIIISGTCAGIAEYFNIDPVIIRILFVLALLFGIWIAGLYIVAAFMLPPQKDPPELTPDQKESIRTVNFRTVLSAVLIFSGFYLALRFFGVIDQFHLFFFSESISFAIISAAAGVFFIFRNPATAVKGKNNPDHFLRSKTDAKILGVCGGLAAYINFDSSSLRILFLLMFFLTAGLFGVFYITAVIWVPEENGAENE